ncbi:MAG TPA: hypothetical protein VN426_04015 [Syntrophomonadaceae bacterium]|nr:hypothetical protein [Syntrophomonadaceae bacterium]
MSVVLQGYHGTFTDCVDEILMNRFTIAKRPDHWLGYGAYFYQDDERHALCWANIKRKRHVAYMGKTVAVIKAIIEVERRHCLNMTLQADFEKLANYAKDFLVSKRGELFVENQLENRCYLYDCFATENEIKVIVASFSKEWADPAATLMFGIIFGEIQICVKDQLTITSKECTYRETPITVSLRKKHWRGKP